VVQDLIYANAKGFNSPQELEDWIQVMKKNYPVKQWELIPDMPITFKTFTAQTRARMTARGFGASNPYQVPKDAERNSQQAQMIQQRGVSPEPVILVRRRYGYELVEGWHRTMQNLQAYPQGYKGPAWVGYL